MTHRLAIIGQSNSIRSRGFVHQLSRMPDIEIGHLGRIGASPSILLPFFAGDVFLRDHDFLVIDVAVVDQLFSWAGALDPASMASYLTYGIHRAHMVGCVPVVLVLPHQASVPGRGSREIPFLHQMYRQIARLNGALCIDLLPLLMRLREQDEAAFAAAYDDPNHISEDVARRAACLLAELFDAVAAAPLARRRRAVALPQFAQVPLADFPHGLPEVERSNSVFSARYLGFAAGDEMEVPTGPIERVHGLLINRSTSDGVIELTGAGRIAKRLGTEGERDLPYVAQVLPLLGAVRDAGGVVKLRLAAAATPPTEVTWNAMSVAGDKAEIAALLLEYMPAVFEVDEPIFEGLDRFRS